MVIKMVHAIYAIADEPLTQERVLAAWQTLARELGWDGVDCRLRLDDVGKTDPYRRKP